VTRWAGVDVGGRRKGFDVAVVDTERVVAVGRRRPHPLGILAYLAEYRPHVVAVDSPCCAAPPGTRSRVGERRLSQAVCGIRFTPSQAVLDEGNAYYEWIVHGLELYRALAKAPWKVIECFPTASWTRLLGPKGRGRSRAAWTRAGLASLGLEQIPPETNQDVRDALAAAVTARLYDQKQTEAFGEIEVPRPDATESTRSSRK
jgi:predicted nuclease with RNAse H fold